MIALLLRGFDTLCFFHVLLGMVVTRVIHLVISASHVIHGSDQFILPGHSHDNDTSLCHDVRCLN